MVIEPSHWHSTSATFSFGPRFLAPHVAPAWRADSHAAVLVRTFDLKERFLFGFVTSVKHMWETPGQTQVNARSCRPEPPGCGN
jgi:hypothetical protein